MLKRHKTSLLPAILVGNLVVKEKVISLYKKTVDNFKEIPSEKIIQLLGGKMIP